MHTHKKLLASNDNSCDNSEIFSHYFEPIWNSLKMNYEEKMFIKLWNRAPLLHMYFHVRHHFVRLPLCWWEGFSSTAIPIVPSDVVGQQNKIAGITFKAALNIG